jgi:hypothetical protein
MIDEENVFAMGMKLDGETRRLRISIRKEDSSILLRIKR